jgi:hypothetical protein
VPLRDGIWLMLNRGGSVLSVRIVREQERARVSDERADHHASGQGYARNLETFAALAHSSNRGA